MVDIGKNAPNPLDITLGSRIHQLRCGLGLSQKQLAHAIGVTFQQVQKYERGINRISFSRLVGIAQALQCSISDLMGNLDTIDASVPPDRNIANIFEIPGATELLDAYTAISSTKHRRVVLDLARVLSSTVDQD